MLLDYPITICHTNNKLKSKHSCCMGWFLYLFLETKNKSNKRKREKMSSNLYSLLLFDQLKMMMRGHIPSSNPDSSSRQKQGARDLRPSTGLAARKRFDCTFGSIRIFFSFFVKSLLETELLKVAVEISR